MKISFKHGPLVGWMRGDPEWYLLPTLTVDKRDLRKDQCETYLNFYWLKFVISMRVW